MKFKKIIALLLSLSIAATGGTLVLADDEFAD